MNTSDWTDDNFDSIGCSTTIEVCSSDIISVRSRRYDSSISCSKWSRIGRCRPIDGRSSCCGSSQCSSSTCGDRLIYSRVHCWFWFDCHIYRIFRRTSIERRSRYILSTNTWRKWYVIHYSIVPIDCPIWCRIERHLFSCTHTLICSCIHCRFDGCCRYRKRCACCTSCTILDQYRIYSWW